MAYVGFVCVASTVAVYAFYSSRGVLDFAVRTAPIARPPDYLRTHPAVCHTTLHARQPFSIWLGVRLNGLLAALVLPLLQMAILFLGPLLLAYYDKDLPFQQHFSMRDVHEAFLSIQGVRNHIVVGA